MLKKLRFLVFVGVLFVCSIPLMASAYSINYTFAVPGAFPNEFTSPYAGVTVEDFTGSLLWTWTGSFDVLIGDVPNKASAPFGVSTKDTSEYVTVPKNLSDVPQDVLVTDLGGTYNYLGLWWGSVDTYNTFSFYNGGSLVESFSGTAIIFPTPANGNQTAPATNLYVNILGLPLFDSFKMSSTQYAFEADNIAIGVVPEPTTLLLLGLGLLGVAGIRRKI